MTRGREGCTPSHAGPVGAVVLAAGLATRMGTLKQLLPLGDVPLVEQVIGNVLASRAAPVVAVLHPAVAAAGHPRRCDPRLHPVVNPHPEAGQAASLRLGLRVLLQAEPATAGAIVMLGDQPLVPPAVLDALITRFLNAREAAPAPHGGPRPPVAVRPAWQGRPGNPVLLARELFPEVLALAGDRGARDVLARYRDRVLACPVHSPAVLQDLDTWEDYREACRALGVPPATPPQAGRPG